MLFVDTTLGVPCQVDSIEVTVEGADGESFSRRADPRSGTQSLTVSQDGDVPSFRVEVVGFRGPDEVARAEANIAFSEEERRSASIVLDDSCRPGPCNVSGSVGDFEVPNPANRLGCEGIASRYSVGEVPFQATVDACEVGIEAREDLGAFQADGEEKSFQDEAFRQLLTDEFNFVFYGQRVQNFWIADDGYISFEPEAPNRLADTVTPGALSSPQAPLLAVVPFWDNLVFRGEGSAGNIRSSVCGALVGSGNNQTLWVTWKRFCFAPGCSSADDATFSVGLEEGSNDITIGFIDMESSVPERARGNLATIGISGPQRLRCDAAECSAEGTCADGTPCGYTQFSSRTPQDEGNWPVTLEFRPVPES